MEEKRKNFLYDPTDPTECPLID